MLLGRALYRSLWREAGNLVDEHAVAYYRTKIRTEFHQTPVPESSQGAVKRTKSAQKLLRQLEAANDGYFHALTRVLETTYGRRGPSKHSLLAPFLPSPIPSHPTPTTFPPALSSLLTSSIAHNSRPPTPAQLLRPPTLPDRAIPNSEEARLLSPLTVQRERAIRKRYFREQVGKVKAPLGVRVLGLEEDGEGEGGRRLKEVLDSVGVRGWKEGNRLLEILEEKARVPLDRQPPLPRRLRAELTTPTPTAPPLSSSSPLPPSPKLITRQEKLRLVPRVLRPSSNNTKWRSPKTITPRLLRRIYQRILADSPIVSITVPPSSSSPHSKDTSNLPTKTKTKLRINVVQSPFATGGVATRAVLSDEDLWWIENWRQEEGNNGKMKAARAVEIKAAREEVNKLVKEGVLDSILGLSPFLIE